jgi:hypothetical protein
MSYREENGQVILTMSREDYERVLMVFGAATAAFLSRSGDLGWVLSLLDRINEGNPHYRPYTVKR